MLPKGQIPPLYNVIQPSNGESVVSAYAQFAKQYGLPPADVYESKPRGDYKAALHLIYAGPVPVEFIAMSEEAKQFLCTRIITFLAGRPDGVTNREIAIELQTEQVFSDTALKSLVDQQRVVADMKPTLVADRYRTVYFLAAPGV